MTKLIEGHALHERVAASFETLMRLDADEALSPYELTEVYMAMMGKFVQDFIPANDRAGFAMHCAKLFLSNVMPRDEMIKSLLPQEGTKH